MREIIGLTGDIHSGKSTFAKELYNINPEAHAYYETGGYVIKVADAFNIEYGRTEGSYIERVNRTLQELDYKDLFKATAILRTPQLDLADIEAHPDDFAELLSEYLPAVDANPHLLEKPIATGSKEDYRKLLQWLGNYFATRVNKHIWFKEIFKDVEQDDKDKELIITAALRKLADEISVRSNGTGTPGRIVGIIRPGHTSDRTSPSEIERLGIKPDVIINNSGTAKQLGQLARIFYEDLRAGQLKKVYHPRHIAIRERSRQLRADAA